MQAGKEHILYLVCVGGDHFHGEEGGGGKANADGQYNLESVSRYHSRGTRDEAQHCEVFVDVLLFVGGIRRKSKRCLGGVVVFVAEEKCL